MLRLLASRLPQAGISNPRTRSASPLHAAPRMSWPIFPDAFSCTTSNASAIKFRFGPSDERYDDEQKDDEHEYTGEIHAQPCLAKNAAVKFSKCCRPKGACLSARLPANFVRRKLRFAKTSNSCSTKANSSARMVARCR